MHETKTLALAGLVALGMGSWAMAQTAHPNQPLGAEDRLGGAPTGTPSAEQPKTPAVGTENNDLYKGRSSQTISPAAPLGGAGETTQTGR